MKTRMPVDAVDVVFRTIWPDLRDHGSWIYGCTLMLFVLSVARTREQKYI
jgi:hypothetical protein